MAGLLRRTDAADIRARERHWSLVPPDVARRLKPRVGRVGDALLTLLGRSDALRMNRVTGFGHRGQAKEEMIDEIIAFYRAARLKRFSLILAPGPQSKQITGWLMARGFERRGGYSLLVRDARTPVLRGTADVRVARAKRDQAPVIVAILGQSFAMPESRRQWSIEAARSSGVENYLAYVGRTPVAVGALRVDADLAWIGGAATLTPWRCRGAHSALIATRLRRAARRGCRWAWVETMLPAPGRPTGSRRNLLRLGFEEVCVKPMFVWREG